MDRAGATETSAEPSTSKAKGELGRAGAPLGSARDASDDKSGPASFATTTTRVTPAVDSEPEPTPPPVAAAKDGPPRGNASNAAPKKMGTNLYDVSWSLEEQDILENGLRTYAEGAYEGPWRYIKIAAHLPAKGVRDVALRVRWMKRKHASEKTSAKRRKVAAAPIANGAHPEGAGARPDGSGSNPAGGGRGGSGARESERKTKKAGEKGAGAVGRRAIRDAPGGPSSGATVGEAVSAGRPKSVFSMPMPGSLAAPGLGPADGMGGAGHAAGRRALGPPPGYGAMGVGVGTGVLPVHGVPGYAYHPPGVPPGMYPPAYPHVVMPPVLPAGAPHPSAPALHAPPPAAPEGALEPHGGVAITEGVGAIDHRLYARLMSNAAIIARLRDDDAARGGTDGTADVETFARGTVNVANVANVANDADVADVANVANVADDADSPRGASRAARAAPALLSTKQRLALLTEFRDALLEIAEMMRGAAGIMRRMPPLPVALNGALASALLPPPKTSLPSHGSDDRAHVPMTFVPPAEPPDGAERPRAPSRARATRRANASPAEKAKVKREASAGAAGTRRGAAPKKKGAGAAASPRAKAGGRGSKR